jgi:hypothetical protein
MGLGDAPGNSQNTGWFTQGEKIDLLAGDKPDRLIYQGPKPIKIP